MRHEPELDITEFDPNNDRTQLAPAMAVTDVQTANLRDFAANGGKLMMYQGWNDYPLRPQRAINYLAEAEEQNGGPAKTAEFFRLFMVPGDGTLCRWSRCLGSRLCGPLGHVARDRYST